MKIILTFVFCGLAFMMGRGYERQQQKPIIAERVAEAHRAAATPAQHSAAWMYDPEHRTALDNPRK